VWIFRFLSKAQNDKTGFFFDLCLQVAWLLFKNGFKWQFEIFTKTQITKGSSPCRPRQVGFVSLNPNLYEKSAYKGRGVQGFGRTFL